MSIRFFIFVAYLIISWLPLHFELDLKQTQFLLPFSSCLMAWALMDRMDR